MESFAWYLLKSAIWLAGFSLVYLLFLQNERFFRLKRYYLVAGILVSFLFPLITFHYKTALPPGHEVAGFQYPAGLDYGTSHLSGIGFDAGNLLTAIYFAGILLLVFKSIVQITSLLKSVRGKKINIINNAKIVKTSEFSGSFSFLNYIFINPSVSGAEMDAIMNHELVHVNQMHWVDLLLADLLRLIQWVNPFAWIYIRFIRQNHEYIADEVALETGADRALYKAVLVNQLLGTKAINLSNYFSYSLNRRRFEMMNKAFRSPYKKIKLFLIVPVIVFIFYAFATPEYKPAGEGFSSGKVVPGTEKKSTVNGVGYQVLPRPDFEKMKTLGNNNPEKKKPLNSASIPNIQKLAVVSPPIPTPAEPYVVVEQMPRYPGGEGELLRFLAENTVYPSEAKAKGTQGKVIIKFAVNTEGKPEAISVIKGVDPLLDAEAARVVSLLSGFHPGMQGGKAVPVWYMVPINFTLSETSQSL